MGRALSIVATVGLVLAGLAVGLVVADRALGSLANPRFTPLAGPRSTRTTLARPEFRVAVQTNSAGFRGGALPGPKPPGVYRIVALGDSFTFGFGVRERQAWPARIEALLNRRPGGAPRVEVVNLGVPGTGPRDYLWHLVRSGLALEPDLVLVGFFANDVNDVYQLDRFGIRSPLFALGAVRDGGSGARPWWKRAADAALPNLYTVAGRAARLAAGPPEARAATAPPAAPAGTTPAAILAALGARYGRRGALLDRYAHLLPEDRAAVDRLVAGEPLGDDVRPALLLSALVDPDAEADAVLLRSAERRAAWDDTAGVLERIVEVARRHGADTVFVVIPASEQVDQARWPTLQGAGFRIDPAMLTDTTLTDRVAALGDRTGAKVVDLLHPFRAHRGAHLYYTVDEHWNAAGQAFAAARVARAVSARIGGGS